MGVFFLYLLANEWATKASSSRRFFIFLPPTRSGTTTWPTDSIVVRTYNGFLFLLFLIQIDFKTETFLLVFMVSTKMFF